MSNRVLLSKKEVRLGLVDLTSCNKNYILILMVLRGTKSIDGIVIEESDNVGTLMRNINKNTILQEVNIIILDDASIMDIIRQVFMRKRCILISDVPKGVISELNYFIRFLKRIKEEYLKLRGCRETK